MSSPPQVIPPGAHTQRKGRRDRSAAAAPVVVDGNGATEQPEVRPRRRERSSQHRSEQSLTQSPVGLTPQALLSHVESADLFAPNVTQPPPATPTALTADTVGATPSQEAPTQAAPVAPVHFSINDCVCEAAPNVVEGVEVPHHGTGRRAARFHPHAALGPYLLLQDVATGRVLLPSGLDGRVTVFEGASYVAVRFAVPSGELLSATSVGPTGAATSWAGPGIESNTGSGAATASGGFVGEPFARPRFWQDTRDFTILAAVDDAATAALNRFGVRTEEVRRTVEDAVLENLKYRVLSRLMDDPTVRGALEQAQSAAVQEGESVSSSSGAPATVAANAASVSQQRIDLFQAVGAAAATELLQARAELAQTELKAGPNATTGRATAVPLDVQLLERLAEVEAAESMKRSQDSLLMRQMGRLFTRVAGLAQSSASAPSA